MVGKFNHHFHKFFLLMIAGQLPGVTAPIPGVGVLPNLYNLAAGQVTHVFLFFGLFNLSFNREWSFCCDLASKFDNELSLFLGNTCIFYYLIMFVAF